jgi:phage-related minor tail protein
MSDHWKQELTKAFADLKTRVERLAQARASTHAGFHAKDRSEEWKQRARFEQELSYEVGFLREIRDAVDERITERQRLVDEQVEKRARGRQEGGGLNGHKNPSSAQTARNRLETTRIHDRLEA